MADVAPFRALHYALARVGGLQPVAAPPYDVIDDDQRAALLRQSPYNVVEIDLPRDAGDPYRHAAAVLDEWLPSRPPAAVLEEWLASGVLARDAEPALWALRQDYTGPDGRARTRQGIFA